MLQHPRVRPLFLLLAIGWAAVIYYLSDQPGIDLPPLFPHVDKLLHLIAYGVLGFLAMGACSPAACRQHSGYYWLIVALAGLYGVLDEYHQSFVPGRDTDPYDALADVCGGLLGAGLMFLLLRRSAANTAPATARGTATNPGRRRRTPGNTD
ncbi:MAG: VanZ family protein [Pseudomonadota bacterium]